MSSDENYKIPALTKILNSSLITDVYPMVKEVNVNKIGNSKGSNYLSLTILVDDYITYDNMYQNEFDPHYMIGFHVEKILPYVSINVTNIEWDIYATSGRYVTGIELIGFGNAKYCRPDKDGNKLCK